MCFIKVAVLRIWKVIYLSYVVTAWVPKGTDFSTSEQAFHYNLWSMLHAELTSSCRLTEWGGVSEWNTIIGGEYVTFLFCIPRGLYAIMSRVSGTGGGGTMDCAR